MIKVDGNDQIIGKYGADEEPAIKVITLPKIVDEEKDNVTVSWSTKFTKTYACNCISIK